MGTYVLDFDCCTFHQTEVPDEVLQLQPAQTFSCNMIILDDECPQAIPQHANTLTPPIVDIPANVHPALISVLQDFKIFIAFFNRIGYHRTHHKHWGSITNQSSTSSDSILLCRKSPPAT